MYTIIGEYDNTGFPLSYCLLTTASSLEEGKRTRALEAWATALRDNYGLTPRFVHTDKDMAEIGASRRVWPEAKHQLCWWHQREALRRRLKGNLPTSVYNPLRAKREHGFINLAFRPHGRADPNDIEGGIPGVVYEQEIQRANDLLTSINPNSLKIRIPMCSAGNTQGEGHNVGGTSLVRGGPDLLGRIIFTQLNAHRLSNQQHTPTVQNLQFEFLLLQ